LDCQHLRSCALVLTLFLFQKGQGFFPPLPIAALLPRSWRGASLSLAGWDASMWPEGFAAWINGLMFFSRSRRWVYAALAGWDVLVWLGYFCNAKGQRDFKITLAFIASHEACRRMAV
ncbi:MAG: hypothetical protein SOX38_10800, partial [Candidatus Limiplasma sp.]|nr:hypothetical protein [Candidatus Limiplasma sp.]